MPRTDAATYQFRLELFNERREPVHEITLAPADFHRAVEAGFFEKLRAGVFTDYDPPLGRARVEPHFDDGDASPHVEAFDVVLPGPDGEEHRSRFTSDYFANRALRLTADLVRDSNLPEKRKVLYQLAAYLDDGETAPRRGRIVLEPPSVEVPVRNVPRRGIGPAEPWDGPRADEMPVLLPRHVLQESVEEAKRAPDREVGGVLLGHLCRDPETGRLYLRVTCQVPAEETESTTTSVTFTAATWQRVREVIDIRSEGEVFAGWVHSHPFRFCKDCPLPVPDDCLKKVLFYSGDDEFLMEQTFARPFMVGLLTAVEPRLEQKLGHLPVKLYGWRNGVIEPRGFEVIDD